MLIVKGNIFRNVSEQEAEKFKQQGYRVVTAAPKKGGKNGDAKSGTA